MTTNINKKLIATLRNKKIGDLNSSELSIVIMDELEQKKISKEDKKDILDALIMASVLHSKQVRKSRNQHINSPYIEHPIRNTLRILKWGVKQKEILIGSLLHDCVEDCSDEYCQIVFEKKINNKQLEQKKLLEYIKQRYGARTERIIIGVTNPPFTGNKEEKQEQYRKHVTKEIKNTDILIVKFSDFVDNAIGLKFSTDKEFIKRQEKKYYPLFDVFKEEIKKQKEYLPVTVDGYEDMIYKLEYGKEEYTYKP